MHIVVRRISCTPLEEDEPDVGLRGVKAGLEDFLSRSEVQHAAELAHTHTHIL